MTFPTATLVRLLILAGLSVSGGSRADWVIAPDIEAVKPLPSDNLRQPQNPPSFSWSQHKTRPASYVLEVSLNGNVVYTYTTARNWFLPTAAYAPGSYSWRVRPATTTEWSTPRNFTIDSASTLFIVPDTKAVSDSVKRHARPRMLAPGFLMASQWPAAMRAERATPLANMVSEVTYKMSSMRAVQDTDWPLMNTGVATAALSAQNADIRTRINTTGRQLESAALLYRLTGEARYLNEAFVRGDQFARLNAAGPTSYANQDQGTRVIALSLIKAIDFLSAEIDAPRRAAWLNAVNLRTTDIYNDLSGSNNRLDQYPYDSHGGTNLGFLALISTLALGELPQADTWFDFSFRSYVNTVYAWSGPEGGFANGTAYGQYTADYALQIWQPLSEATGVNIFAKPWSTGFLQFFAHFVPPGAVTHAFGDESELAPDFRFMKAYASRFATPAAAWYARNIVGDEDFLTLLQAPYPLPYTRASTSAAPPNAALYQSIGWVAMHSDLADRARTSVYFKSSPFGSYNHSHGDQNSLLLSSGGRPLLIESGYMDWYGSPLFNSWYRQTRAHNAITFDSGIGQLVDGNTINLGRNGKILSFATTPALDYTAGDAINAYGSVLSKAVRKVWYFRPKNVVVVQDLLAAPAPHKFEWNLHAAAPIVPQADGSVSILNVDRKLCARSISTEPATYEARSGPPPQAGKFEAHGAFVKPAATSGEFLVLLDVGCKNLPYTLSAPSATGRTLTVDGQSIVIPNN